METKRVIYRKNVLVTWITRIIFHFLSLFTDKEMCDTLERDIMLVIDDNRISVPVYYINGIKRSSQPLHFFRPTKQSPAFLDNPHGGRSMV